MKLRISGASDDILHITKDGKIDELSAWVNGQTYKGYISIKNPNDHPDYNIRVHVIYDGNWVFAVSHNYEFEQSKPKYERNLDGGRGYSEEIIFDVSEDVIVSFERS